MLIAITIVLLRWCRHKQCDTHTETDCRRQTDKSDEHVIFFAVHYVHLVEIIMRKKYIT